MKITLWGERAAAFSIDGVYNRAEGKPIVVLFVGGLMKFYQRMLSCSLFSLTCATCLFYSIVSR